MFTLKNTIIFTLISIIIAALVVWLFLFQDIDVKIKNDIKKGNHVVLLFSAKWCGSCEKQKPIYKKVQNDYAGINFYVIGSELSKIKQKLLFKYYKIKGLPTFVIFKDGKEQERLVSFQTEEKLRAAFSQ